MEQTNDFFTSCNTNINAGVGIAILVLGIIFKLFGVKLG